MTTIHQNYNSLLPSFNPASQQDPYDLDLKIEFRVGTDTPPSDSTASATCKGSCDVTCGTITCKGTCDCC